MAAVLGTNMASVWASKNLQSAQSDMANSVERLSSGLRINRAKDDAAGLGIANALTQQINGANQGVRNLNDGISMVQTAEGAIAAASEMAQRILTLATQGANGSMSTAQRKSLSNELTQLWASIGSIQTRTKFSGTALLGATADTTIVASNVASDTVTIGFADSINAIWTDTVPGAYTTTYAGAAGDMKKSIAAMATAATADPSTVAASDFTTVIAEVNTYISALDTQRGSLGALQNRMEFAVDNVSSLAANLTAARSRVIDTDYASETASLTKGQILQQAATAMLAQANQMPNVILSLLK
jgi:flagellin